MFDMRVRHYDSRNGAGPVGGASHWCSLNTAASCSRSHRLRGSVSKRRCQCNFRSYSISNGGSAATTCEVSDVNLVTTANGNVATSCDSMTMNGTLSTCEV